MTLVVTGVGLLIHIYSVGYMSHDRSYARFFAYLNLFTFAMLVLVLGANLAVMFIGWEGVGLCSYLLIGFWFTKDSAADAGKKAFITNRVGDFGFLLGTGLLLFALGTIDIAGITAAVEGGMLAKGTATAAALLLFLGATGKSAQIPLYTWLPDAMEGPTPVSALIHAATMVTAGVYMVARLHALFSLSGTAMTVVALTGAFTAVYAATMGFVQTDIKRVLAYSTISQIGYMFIGLGVGAYAAGIFHLMTHAFFKSLLFLAAGSVIHALSGEQDMRRMGGLRKRIPRTYLVFLVGALAISGLPGLSGFFSKDEILASAFASGNYLVWGLGLAGAAMTAFYMFRLIFLTFFGEERFSGETARHLHESPPVMLVPLQILALLAIVGGYVGLPHVLGGGAWFRPFPRDEHGSARIASCGGDGDPPHGRLGRRGRGRRSSPPGRSTSNGAGSPPAGSRRDSGRSTGRSPGNITSMKPTTGSSSAESSPWAGSPIGSTGASSTAWSTARPRWRGAFPACPSCSTKASSTAPSTASAASIWPPRRCCAGCRRATSTTTPWPSSWASPWSSPSSSWCYKDMEEPPS